MRVHTITAAALGWTVASAALAGPIVFYGGDFDRRNAVGNYTVSNNSGTVTADQRVFDDFAMPTSTSVEALFGNFLSNRTPTGYAFEIRSGVSSGNGGTIVASGTATTGFTWVATGRSAFGLTEYTLRADVANFFLAAGTYHLNIRPLITTNQSFEVYLSSTSGTNGVGSPLNNVNAFVKGGPTNLNFTPIQNTGLGFLDFSQGVEVVPLPGAAAMAGACLGLLAVRRRRRAS
ncbi:MAG: hypothetical protein SFY69_04770 [Planctomycetota bacterium]|nr:hypothetical protein [Planctomycetota bacterium]